MAKMSLNHLKDTKEENYKVQIFTIIFRYRLFPYLLNHTFFLICLLLIIQEEWKYNLF